MAENVVSDETNGQRLLDVEGLSRYLSLPKSTLYTWRCTRKIPASAIVKFGRALRFEKAEIDRWVETMRAAEGEPRQRRVSGG